jgi:hypothetical protein
VNVLDLWTGYGGVVHEAPIASRFDFGEGRVVYTSFHNEHVATTSDMVTLLEQMLISL